jgi:hypothetical protein
MMNIRHSCFLRQKASKIALKPLLFANFRQNLVVDSLWKKSWQKIRTMRWSIHPFGMLVYFLRPCGTLRKIGKADILDTRGDEND